MFLPDPPRAPPAPPPKEGKSEGSKGAPPGPSLRQIISTLQTLRFSSRAQASEQIISNFFTLTPFFLKTVGSLSWRRCFVTSPYCDHLGHPCFGHLPLQNELVSASPPADLGCAPADPPSEAPPCLPCSLQGPPSPLTQASLLWQGSEDCPSLALTDCRYHTASLGVAPLQKKFIKASVALILSIADLHINI